MSRRNDDIHIEADEFGGQPWSALEITLCIPPLDDNVLAVNPSQCAQPLGEWIGSRRCSIAEYSYAGNPGRSLAFGHKRHEAGTDRQNDRDDKA